MMTSLPAQNGCMQVGLEPLAPHQSPLKKPNRHNHSTPGELNMHQKVQPCPKADQSLRHADSAGAETARQKVSWSALALLNYTATPEVLRFKAVLNGFLMPMSRSRTSSLRAGLCERQGLWQRQSQISWKWLSRTLVSV
jgi:hypothetical protein